MRIAAALFCCLWCIQPVQAQFATPPKNLPYKAAVRFNFIGVIDPVDNNISLGGELPFHPNWSVITDLAYIEHSSYLPNIRWTRGYMVKPAIRYYPFSMRHTGFLEAVLFYKQVTYHQHDWLGKDCVNSVPAYQQYQDFLYQKRVAGFNLQLGWQAPLSRNKLFWLEVWGGLGVRIRQQDVINQENACYNDITSAVDINGSSGTAVLSSLPAGIRLVYCVRR